MSDDTISASDLTSAEASLSSPAAEPVSTPESTPASVATTAQPDGATTLPAAAATTVSSTDATKPAGPIPFEVHKTALENARVKAAQDAQAQFTQQYGWATQVNPQEFQQVQQLARTLSANPIEGLQQLISEIRKNPQYDAQLKSLAARALAQGRSPAAPAEPQMVQVQLEDGSIVALPRDPQAWLAHQQQQWLAEVEQKLQPLQKTHETLQAERQALAQQQAIDHFVSTTYADVQTWPGMDRPESKAAIANALAQARIDPNDPREVALALNAAYRQTVLPTLHVASRQAVLNDINRQAAASTVNPAHASTRGPKTMDEMSLVEALHHVAAQSA